MKTYYAQKENDNSDPFIDTYLHKDCILIDKCEANDLLDASFKFNTKIKSKVIN